MSNKKKRFLAVCSLLLGLVLWGGFKITDQVYQFPLKGYNALSGTFGELRTNHFHSGMDLKVGGKSGAPLYAIQDGYVYRIKVSPFGFGNAVYLRHQDGRFSVYAHMSRFNDQIEDYTYLRQYGSKKYAQELYLSKDEIPVSKGQVIGYAGNSGSSTGPHLHFEIRDPEERILNPLQYYKHLIKDHKKPIVQEIAFEPIDLNSRVRGEFRKYSVTPSGSNGSYRVDPIVKIQGRVGLEYRAYDLLDAAGNHCGINYARLYIDDELVYAYSLDRFAFDEKRYINLHIDYPHYRKKRSRLQRAYVERGNLFNAYKHQVDQGLIELTDGEIHKFRLVLTDAHDNQSFVSGRLQLDPAQRKIPASLASNGSPSYSYEIHRDILRLRVLNPRNEYLEGMYYENLYGEQKAIPAAYAKGKELIFLLPLTRHDYPQRIMDGNGKTLLNLNLKEEILSSQNNLFEMDELQLFFPYQSVFDRVHLEMSKEMGDRRMLSDVFVIGDPDIPLFKSFLVSFTPKEGIPLKNLVVAQRSKSKWSFAGNTIGEANNVYASVSGFGEYCLMADSIAPTIEPVNFKNGSTISRNQNTLILRIKDNFSGIDDQTVYCKLNGEWKLFKYDYKRNSITHNLGKQTRPKAGSYELEVLVTDKAHNLAKKTYRLQF
ncbi:MAG: M23 family metallopeptidase [Bacteroidota bacterium]